MKSLAKNHLAAVVLVFIAVWCEQFVKHPVVIQYLASHAWLEAIWDSALKAAVIIGVASPAYWGRLIRREQKNPQQPEGPAKE